MLSFTEQREKALNQILKVKFTLPNGQLETVFKKNQFNDRNYDCLLCSRHDLNEFNVISHATGRQHNQNVDLVDVDTSSEKGGTPDHIRPPCNDKKSSVNFEARDERLKTSATPATPDHSRPQFKDRNPNVDFESRDERDTKMKPVATPHYIRPQHKDRNPNVDFEARDGCDTKMKPVATPHYIRPQYKDRNPTVNFGTRIDCDRSPEYTLPTLPPLPRIDGKSVRKGDGKRSELQSAINKTEDRAIIGTEYILVIQSHQDSFYRCILCQEIFHQIDDVVNHIISYNHRFNYLKKIFPKVFDEVTYLIEAVCDGIEDRYGRSNVTVLDNREFMENKEKYSRIGTKYVNKNIGCQELIGKDNPVPTTTNFDYISISSDSQSDAEPGEVGEVKSGAITVIEKLKQFRAHINAAKFELQHFYQQYIENPTSHPNYYEMWVTFWKKGYNHLRSENKLITYDWQSEWAAEWTRLMNESMKTKFAAKCSEIKEKFGVNDENLGELEKKLLRLSDLVSPFISNPPTTSNLSNESRSPEITRSSGRSRSPNASHSPNRKGDRNASRSPNRPGARNPSPAPQQRAVPSAAQNCNSNLTAASISQDQKTTPVLSSKRQTPLRLEQLLEQHKHNDDFLVSWKELLALFEIHEDNSSESNAAVKSVPVTNQTHEERSDCPKKVLDLMEVSDRIAVVQAQPAETVGPITVISVLSVLTALENLLGSLGPKLIHLLQKAISMDRSNADSSDFLLDDNQNCILFETIKEKLKGLLAADLVAPNLQNIVRKAIKDMADLVEQSVERKKTWYTEPTSNQSVDEPSPPPRTFVYMEPSMHPATKDDDRVTTRPNNCFEQRTKETSYESQAIFDAESWMNPVTNEVDSVATNKNNDDVQRPVNQTTEETEPQSFLDAEPSMSPVANNTTDSVANNDDGLSLQDSEIRTLMSNFTTLPEREKQNFTTHLSRLKMSDPDRLDRLRREVCKTNTAANVLEWEKWMYCPGEAIYSDSNDNMESALNVHGSADRKSSKAYQVAKNCAGVKIRRKTCDERTDVLMRPPPKVAKNGSGVMFRRQSYDEN